MDQKHHCKQEIFLYKKLHRSLKPIRKFSKATDNKLSYFKVSSLNHKNGEKVKKNVLTKAS